jgi:ankyrin repeat protein
LSRAAEIGDKVVVELLLNSGARPDLEDADGHTPLSRAKDNVDVVQLLNRYIWSYNVGLTRSGCKSRRDILASSL